MKKIALFFICFIGIYFYSFSQENKIIEVTGKIISGKDSKPIHYATIINIKKGTATSCDSLGYFHITMLKDDILRINALGFERKYFSFDDSVINTSEIIIIKLTEKTYKIAGVDIFEARWKDFEFEFSQVEIKKDETKERIEKLFYSLIDPKELALITASQVVGSFALNYKTKSDKQKIKVKELEKEEVENKIIESKFNPELVSEITNLNETEVIKFMRFCNFDRDFLLSSNDYDIIVEIKKRFEVYYNNKSR